MYFQSNSPASEPLDGVNHEASRVVLDIDEFVSPNSRILSHLEMPIADLLADPLVPLDKENCVGKTAIQPPAPPTPPHAHPLPLPPTDTLRAQAVPQTIFRDIGTVELSLRPDAFDPFASLFFSSPLLLILHALKIRHDIKVIPANATPASLNVTFNKGDMSFSSEVSTVFGKTEYPIIRQVLRRVGLYQTPGSDQEDLWCDELLAVLSAWSSLLKDHRRAVLALDASPLPLHEDLMTTIDAYPAIRASFYHSLNDLWASKKKTQGPRSDAYRILTQQMLYADGAARELLIDFISDFYGKTVQHEDMKHWTRNLHGAWAKDHLLQYESLFDLNGEVMASATIRAWYLGREQSHMAPNDTAVPLALHEAIMSGQVEDGARLAATHQPSLLPPPDRSAALSPRPASPAPDRMGEPLMPSQTWARGSSFSAEVFAPGYPQPPPPPPMSPHGYPVPPGQERRPYAPIGEPDWFAEMPDDFRYQMDLDSHGAIIGKRSPIHQSICTSPPARNKKRFGYC